MQLDYLIFLSLLYLFFLFPKITKVDGDLWRSLRYTKEQCKTIRVYQLSLMDRVMLPYA